MLLSLQDCAYDTVQRSTASSVGADTVAIATQIRGDDVEALGRQRRDLVPEDMGQRIAVQQQKRRAVAAMTQMDPRAAPRDLGTGEPFEHPYLHR